ncbi:hypothetical protein FRC04_006520 [Tulasnella sp. 424]|nr:hypothetical protein FRC04_006520 [Tulasnella sp. 424]KAG8981021.1 hypothetical protein FRC05_003921 [Tulasnella sp. 425]
MIIPLKFPTNTNTEELPPQLARLGSNEVVLIELQGFLEIEGEAHEGEEVVVGTLSMDNPDRPTLTIGNHLLEGKIVNLNKPLAVLSRNAPPPDAHVRKILSSSSSQPQQQQPDSSPVKPTPAGKTEDDIDFEQADADNGSFDVVAVVKRKIVFAKRPVPIVGKEIKDDATT